jgi:integrase
MQRGQIFKHRGNWRLRYWDTAIVDGRKKRIRRATFLAEIGKDYPTKRSVMALADRILTPLNAGENFYLPHVKQELRPSTYKDYKRDIFEKHVKLRLGELRLRDFRTVNGQRILRDIATANSDVGHKTLLRIKSFLSGAFKHAKREGFIDGENPMRDTAAPGKAEKFVGEVYTMSEIEMITNCVADTEDITDPKEIRERTRASTVIAVAALTGLRLSEIRGLRWSDYEGATLTIRRAVWRTHVGDTKNPASASSIPVLPVLENILDDHRNQVVAGKKYFGADDYIFAGERRGAPLNLANLVRRVIIPALDTSEQGPLKWKGWHAFRRSLATNLYSCGVAPRIIQAILRHSDIGTTMQYYVQAPDPEMRVALEKIDEWITKRT